MHRLDHNVDSAFELVNKSFQEIIDSTEKRRQEVLTMIKRTRDDKKKILQEQVSLIQDERDQVEDEVKGLHHQVEVHNISQLLRRNKTTWQTSSDFSVCKIEYFKSPSAS